VYRLRAKSTLSKKFFLVSANKVVLFDCPLRVSRCGLFFARFFNVQRSSLRIWELCGGDFVDQKYELAENPKKSNMSEKKTIRIIKKGENNRPAPKPKVNTARVAARDMVETVTNWVSEFQQRRRTETTHALRILAKTPRSSEA
jgi:hypothetical protein